MKKTILASALALMTMTAAWAQREHKRDFDPEQKAQMKVERISDAVEVSPDEQQALLEVYTEYFSSRKAMMEEGDESKDRKSEMRDQKTERIIEILGDERYSAYKEAMQDHKEEHKHMHKKKHMHKEDIKRERQGGGSMQMRSE